MGTGGEKRKMPLLKAFPNKEELAAVSDLAEGKRKENWSRGKNVMNIFIMTSTSVSSLFPRRLGANRLL